MQSRARMFRGGQKRPCFPGFLHAGDFFLHRIQIGVKTFVPSDETSSRVLFRKALAFPMRPLHLEHFLTLDARSMKGKLQTMMNFAQ